MKAVTEMQDIPIGPTSLLGDECGLTPARSNEIREAVGRKTGLLNDPEQYMYNLRLVVYTVCKDRQEVDYALLFGGWLLGFSDRVRCDALAELLERL